MYLSLPLCWFALNILSCAHQPASTTDASGLKTALDTLLDEQAKNWTAGDLKAFCSIYSTDAVFIAPSGRTLGRDAIYNRYLKKYNTPEKRGTLSLKTEHFTPSPDLAGAAIVLRWAISYPQKDALSGWSLVVFRKTPKGWRIVQDASM